jgi:hypothetical protein
VVVDVYEALLELSSRTGTILSELAVLLLSQVAVLPIKRPSLLNVHQ